MHPLSQFVTSVTTTALVALVVVSVCLVLFLRGRRFARRRSGHMTLAVGFNPRSVVCIPFRRVATDESNPGNPVNRRSATRIMVTCAFRGLKPTANFRLSLRDTDPFLTPPRYRLWFLSGILDWQNESNAYAVGIWD